MSLSRKEKEPNRTLFEWKLNDRSVDLEARNVQVSPHLFQGGRNIVLMLHSWLHWRVNLLH
jgi:hypothetical protein